MGDTKNYLNIAMFYMCELMGHFQAVLRVFGMKEGS